MSRRHRSVAISDITVGRGRRPRGDITDLASSIEAVGMLNPVTLTDDLRLVAGLHRLEAAKQLGWFKIPAVVLSLSKLETQLAELDENLQRRELTVLERGEQLARRKQIYEALHPETRRGAAGGYAKAKGASEIISFAESTGRANHLSPRTIQHEVQIAQNIPASTRKKLRGTRVENRKVDLVKIARLPHAEQAAVAEMLSTGEAPSLGAALSSLAASKIEEHDEDLPNGSFSVIVADPPWPHDENKRPYPCMTLDEIMALDVPGISAASSVCLLWVAPTLIKQGVETLEHWGFRQVGFVTWQKTNSRPGHYVMQTSELCLIGVKGKPKVRKALPNVIKAPVRQHSRKPNEFYQWASDSFAGSRVDLFARESRTGWQTWGAERTKFDWRGRLDTFFSYFGGKWRIAKHYPAPEHETIVEPFAGAAGYATTYADRKVILYEKDPVIYELWDYLIGVSPADIRALPDKVAHVDDVKAPDPAKSLVGFWLNKGTSSPRKSPCGWARGGTRPNSYWGPAIKERIAYQVDCIKHWKIKHGSFETARNTKATWFVDPPYQGECGTAYRHSDVDYKSLGDWCQGRRGQVIVCEQQGADWLPFVPLGNFKARGRERSREAIWTSSAR